MNTSRKPRPPADTVARYMSRYEREAARVRVERAMFLGQWTLEFAAGVRSALYEAGIAFVRAVTLS
ncbi:MAG TPA: hypothetical protein VMN56_07520 [Casimicrobiaceae bacterium]|nr:hypothetical protein [Casimicrobiaceae bacterium]